MVLWLCLIAIIAAILLGWKFDFNIGILAMAFAFIINVFFMGGKISTVVSYWPTSIVFFLLAIGLFFSYATSNGTMELLGKKLLYAMNGNAKLIPWAIALVCSIVAFLGAGGSTPAIIAPLALTVGLAAGVHPIVLSVSVVCSTMIGSDNPINGFGGVIARNLIEAQGYENSFDLALAVWGYSIITQIIVIGLTYIVFKAYKAKRVEVQKPQPFTSVQRKTLILILVAFVCMVVPMVLNTWIKGNPVIIKLAAFMQPQAVMILAAIAAALLNLGKEKDIIKQLPIGTILMIAGVSMLLDVAADAGLVEVMSDLLSNNVPAFWVPAMLILIAGFLSNFSSGTSVVCPLMFPLVPLLSQSMGLSASMLFTCIYIGAMSSAASPFSMAGASVIAGAPDLKTKDYLAKHLVPTSLIIPVVIAILATFGLFNIIKI